jgi:hypothetical protein
MFEPALRQLMTGLLLASLLLISGCLTSEKPLIATSDFPIPAGTKVLQYSDKTGTYQEPKTSSLKTLSIRDGWYVYSELDASGMAFKLRKVTASSWVIMMRTGLETGKYAYGWMRHEGDLYVIYLGDAEQFRNWKGQAELNTDWAVVNANVQIFTLDYLANIMPAAIAARAYAKPMAFKVADAATVKADQTIVTPEMLDRIRKANEAHISKLNAQIKENEEKTKALCGGRVCVIRNDTTLYRTEKSDPPVWYYQDGRLAPESVWPK